MVLVLCTLPVMLCIYTKFDQSIAKGFRDTDSRLDPRVVTIYKGA